MPVKVGSQVGPLQWDQAQFLASRSPQTRSHTYTEMSKEGRIEGGINWVTREHLAPNMVNKALEGMNSHNTEVKGC